jgi:DNA-binding transcriptional regulator YdaS (Cro superfamily)
MQLSRLLKKRGAASKLAEKLGVSPSTVTRWRDGACLPDQGHMHLIQEATGGKVKPADFYAPAKRTDRSRG